ncbi:hypothetical protein FB451DRAFT_1385438 [Mycena latifolia]|nr:hypothetical protein FB451DRAFT_1385438 [Mycena latifolia]
MSPARRGDTSSSARCLGAPCLPFPHRVLEAAYPPPACHSVELVRRKRAPNVGLNRAALSLHLSPRRGVLAYVKAYHLVTPREERKNGNITSPSPSIYANLNTDLTNSFFLSIVQHQKVRGRAYRSNTDLTNAFFLSIVQQKSCMLEAEWFCLLPSPPPPLRYDN